MQYVAENIFETLGDQNASTDEQKVLSEKTKDTNKVAPVEVVPPTPPDIEVQNGTKISGLASKTKTKLQQEGLSVIRTANAPTQDYQKTVVYNIGGTNADAEARKVARLVGATVSTTVPSWVQQKKGMNSSTEILIILGTDQQYE